MLGLLPPWIFTQGRREWSTALIDAFDCASLLEQVGDRWPLGPQRIAEMLRDRIGADFPVSVGVLVKAGYLR